MFGTLDVPSGQFLVSFCSVSPTRIEVRHNCSTTWRQTGVIFLDTKENISEAVAFATSYCAQYGCWTFTISALHLWLFVSTGLGQSNAVTDIVVTFLSNKFYPTMQIFRHCLPCISDCRQNTKM